ncbi:MAG: helix-turn-helix domain-containing protein [Candidatus Nealsonbacteria bacterium]|nr:helix-turn-helix domain-containing protein [Candidatus Nealsonbacteria bacterium]
MTESTATPEPITLATIAAKLDALLASRAAPPQRYLGVKASATYSDLSEDTIRRLVERGDLTAHRPVKGKVLIDKQQLDRLILGSTRVPQRGRGRR